jgi:anaerobic selenocysteine-containing dehydrogenase
MTNQANRPPRLSVLRATCGLAIKVEGDQIVSVRGDESDPFSRGFVCPKSVGVKQLHHDPDRLKRPVRRTADGWQEISWGGGL